MPPLQPSFAQRRYPLRYWILVAYCVCVPNFVKFDNSGRTHDVGLFNPTSISVILLTLLSGSLLVIMTFLNRGKLLQRPVKFAGWLWLLLLANFVISTIFSPPSRLTPAKVTDPFLCLFRIGEWILLFVLILSVYSREKEESATDLIVRVIASVCWINIGCVWFFLPIMPSLVYGASEDITNSHARLGGVMVHPVHLSVLTGIAFFHSFFFLKSYRKYACCAFAGLTLFMTYARSEQLLFLIVLFAYLLIFSRKSVLRWFGIFSILSVIGLATAFYEKILAYLARGQGVRNITTLSERTDVWNASFKAFWLRPFIGYGYIIGVKNALKDHWNATNWVPPHSHSEYIQALVTGGIFAGALMVSIYVCVLWSAIRQSTRDPQHMFFLVGLLQLIGMSFIMPITSTAHGEVGSVFVLIYIGVIASAPKKKKKVHQTSAVRSFTLPGALRPVPALRWRQNPSTTRNL